MQFTTKDVDRGRSPACCGTLWLVVRWEARLKMWCLQVRAAGPACMQEHGVHSRLKVRIHAKPRKASGRKAARSTSVKATPKKPTARKKSAA